MRQRWSRVPSFLEAIAIPGFGVDGKGWILGPGVVLVPTQGATESPTTTVRAEFPFIVDVGEGGVALVVGRESVTDVVHVPCCTFTDGFDYIIGAEIFTAKSIDGFCAIGLASVGSHSTRGIAAPRGENCWVCRSRIGHLGESKSDGDGAQDSGNDGIGNHILEQKQSSQSEGEVLNDITDNVLKGW